MQTASLLQYVPIALITLASLGVSAGMYVGNWILGPKRSPSDKSLPASRWEPFECGTVQLQKDNWRRVSPKFYLLAILFVLFDLEVALLYPWASIGKELGVFGFVELVLFLLSLLVGLLYAWKKGGLEWR